MNDMILLSQRQKDSWIERICPFRQSMMKIRNVLIRMLLYDTTSSFC